MHTRRKFLFAILVSATLSSPAFLAAEDVNSVLAKLNTAAARFKATSADCQVDVIETDPIPSTDHQKGTVYYERTGSTFQTAFHIRTINGQPVPKRFIYSKGAATLWEGGNQDQVTTFSKASQYESYLILGFGASGKELADKWNITYLGSEVLDGVKTEKLDLVAKDPAVRRTIPKVTVWMDTDRGVSLKQVFDQGSGQYRVAVYFNVKLNQPLPKDAFTFPTDKNTQYIRK